MFRSTGAQRLAAIVIGLVVLQQAPPAASGSPVVFESAPIELASPAIAPEPEPAAPAPAADAMPATLQALADTRAAAGPVALASEPTAEPSEAPAVEPAEVLVAPAPQPAAPAPKPVAAPAAFSCGPGFCYPRLGISQPLVPYTDCDGRTDLGSSIRIHKCLPATYVVAHAYTDFGRITGWQQGDAVFVNGTRFTITGAIRQAGCTELVHPQTPLSLQTSLTTTDCGPILIVQGR